MKKFKKSIGVVVILIAGLLFFSSKTMDNVYAANKCNNAEKLQNYFGMQYDWSDDDKYLIFSVKNGSFRITDIDHPEYFENSFSKESNGFYKIDGNNGTLKKDSKLKLKLKNIKNLNIQNENYGFKMKFALSEKDKKYGCLSMPEFKSKKSGATFETGTIEIELPKGTLTEIKTTVDNTNYNGVCVALREGRDPTNSINTGGSNAVDYMKLYDASYRDDYKELMPDCWQAKVNANYSASDMTEIVRTILSATYERHHMSVGEGATDNGTAWLINFENVKKAAEEADAKATNNSEKHVFYTDNDRKFYTKQGGALVFDFNDVKKSINMQCNVKAKSSSDYSNLLEHITKDGKTEYNINANVQNYYAKNVITEKVTYTWNYTKGSHAKDVKTYDACTRTCEEALEVKYGPPVASKAGLCFEYQVQVTSRVKCTADIKISPPKQPPVCTPVPYCNSIPGHIHQAGANDEYKSCIKSCDGGKYTKQCSEKCYKEVYEDNNSATKTTSTNADLSAQKLGVSWSGHHEWSGNSIVWKGGGYARYYKEYEYSRTVREHGTYTSSHGFKKRILADGSLCKDHCVFKKCSKTQYLNRNEAQADYKANLKLYNGAIEKCKAAATCTTKTATFTITTNYIAGSGDEIKVDYPFEELNKDANPEKLKSSDKESECNNPIDVTEDNDIILKYAGCYKKCGEGLQYHSRWSFPGSWINKKTGGLSFSAKSTSGWQKQDKKFCIPLDAGDVNVKWWKYYYGIFANSNETSFSNNNANEKCVNYATEVPTIEKTDIEKWNIYASTRNFGYYGWNLDISCFYALNSKSTKTSDSNSNKELCNTNTQTGTGNQSYKIRTVDLKQLFPDSQTGSGARTPGFNWSSSANIIAAKGKNPEFQSTPATYAEKIQTDNYSIYNEENLDYEFNLTKEMLGNIKSKSRNYTSYDTGKMITQHGLYSYQSKAIREGEFGNNGNKVLNVSAIGCNNVENYNSGQCSNIHKVGE